MPLLIVLCGLPFSGKSTLARRLAAGTGAIRLSYDELWQEQKGETGRSLGFEELSDLAHKRLRAALAAGKSAIYDTLNDTRDGRDRLRALAVEQGAHAFVIYLDTPPEVLAQRRQRCAETGERHSVPSDALRTAAARFEAPESDDDTIVFPPEGDIAALRTTLIRAARRARRRKDSSPDCRRDDASPGAPGLSPGC